MSNSSTLKNPKQTLKDLFNSLSTQDVDENILPVNPVNSVNSVDKSTIIRQKNTTSPKKTNWKLVIISFIIVTIIVTGIIVVNTKSNLLSKYDNISNFSNKDQYEDPNKDNYDIHYLVEQMIYKEFSPSDKKKYLNLPMALKEQLIIDYLIDKI
jgi:hypothetical protein